MSKGKGRDYSGLIIWASVLIGSVRYAAAYLSSDLGQIVGDLSTIVTWMIGVSGFATGILGTLGTAYIFDGWRQKMPAAGVKWGSKFKALTLFVFSAFLCEILILVPFTMSRIRHVAITHVLGAGDWWWSTAVVVMPLLLIGGVSVGNKIVTVNSSETSQKVTENKAESTGNFPVNWRQVRKQLSADDLTFLKTARTEEI